MFLAIDIGNTNVTLGIFEEEKLRATWRLETNIHREPDEYGMLLLDLLRLQGLNASDVKNVALCSVVPPLVATFDTVSKEGDYLGGAIAPGIKTAAEALFTRTAQLHRVEMVRPKRAIGTS